LAKVSRSAKSQNLLMKSGMKTPHRMIAKSVKIPTQSQYVQSAPHVFFMGLPEEYSSCTIVLYFDSDSKKNEELDSFLNIKESRFRLLWRRNLQSPLINFLKSNKDSQMTNSIFIQPTSVCFLLEPHSRSNLPVFSNTVFE